MVLLNTLQTLRRREISFWSRRINVRFSTTKTSDPLRILFCGSDNFSSASLQALFKLQRTCPELIKSIDVLCRPPKRTGRGLKIVREVPVASAARELGLPLHHTDSFKGWELPRYDAADSQLAQDSGSINLIVAVSFGLLIPSRILNAAKYGGLNVHASLLPDFRGAAPIERALLAGCTKTGVTLQTLHPTKMDYGQLLLQWPETGLDIPQSNSIKPAELRELLSPLGAMMLVHGIRNGVYVPPLQEITPLLEKEQLENFRRAPKILQEDLHIRWAEWTAEEILRRQQVLGPLWNNITVEGQTVRLTFPFQFTRVEGDVDGSIPPGVPMYHQSGTRLTSEIWCKTADEKFLCFDRIKVPGFGERVANTWARKVQLFTSSNARDIELGSHGTFTLASARLE